MILQEKNNRLIDATRLITTKNKKVSIWYSLGPG